MRRLHAGNLFKPTVSFAIAKLVAGLIEYVGSEMVTHAIDMMRKFQRIVLSSTRTSLGTSQWIVKSVKMRCSKVHPANAKDEMALKRREQEYARIQLPHRHLSFWTFPCILRRDLRSRQEGMCSRPMALRNHGYPGDFQYGRMLQKVNGRRTWSFSFFFFAMTDSSWTLYGLSLFFRSLLTLGARPVEGALDPMRTIIVARPIPCNQPDGQSVDKEKCTI